MSLKRLKFLVKFQIIEEVIYLEQMHTKQLNFVDKYF